MSRGYHPYYRPHELPKPELPPMKDPAVLEILETSTGRVIRYRIPPQRKRR